MYTKDLSSLLQLLKVSEQSVELRLRPADVAGEAWYARLTLIKGDVTMCQIRRVGDEALLAEGPTALRWLTTLGRLSYEEIQQVSSPMADRVLAPPRRPFSAPTSPAQESEEALSPFVQERLRTGKPRRTAFGEREGAEIISGREHRQVFLLIDGHRSLEEIAGLLHKSPERIQQLLADLSRQGRIE